LKRGIRRWILPTPGLKKGERKSAEQTLRYENLFRSEEKEARGGEEGTSIVNNEDGGSSDKLEFKRSEGGLPRSAGWTGFRIHIYKGFPEESRKKHSFRELGGGGGGSSKRRTKAFPFTRHAGTTCFSRKVRGTYANKN